MPRAASARPLRNSSRPTNRIVDLPGVRNSSIRAWCGLNRAQSMPLGTTRYSPSKYRAMKSRAGTLTAMCGVQPLEVALQERPAVVVAEVAPRHRVEGADVGPAVKAQHRDRQRRNEWLVVMHDVECVLVEQRADAPYEVKRQRDPRHRSVGADRDASSDADVPGDAVVVADPARRREHRHVVAACPQLLRQMPDVLGHPTRVHEVVRRDQADLHRAPAAVQIGSSTCHCSGCSRIAFSKMRSKICAVLRTSASLGVSVEYLISG